MANLSQDSNFSKANKVKLKDQQIITRHQDNNNKTKTKTKQGNKNRQDHLQLLLVLSNRCQVLLNGGDLENKKLSSEKIG